MKKKALAFFLCIVIIISLVPTTALAAGRNTSFEEGLAYDLKALGLFKGVSDTDFALNRAPTRIEALVMLIRVLGKEAEAQGGSWRHPFNDVPSWADQCVGYAYQNGLTNGVSSTQFGSQGAANAAMYLTFVLRALGYSDVNGQDFTWDNPTYLAKNIGILPSCVNLSSFWRADVVIVSYAALPVYLKGSSQTLAQKLIAAGVFTQSQFSSVYDANAISQHQSDPGLPSGELTAEEIYSQCSPAVFYIEVYNASGKATASGSGFFIDSSGTAVTNFHVIEGASSAKITLSNTAMTYTVAGVYDYSVDEDWAVLKINGSGFPYLEFGDTSTVIGGATVYAIGSPLGLQNTISSGIISNPSRLTDGVKYIQTTASISSGSSGGALINKFGEVIGITSATYESGQNLNLAVPITYVQGYSRYSVTPLSSLPGAGSNPSTGNNQYDAYALLRAFVNSNYNTTLDGDRAFKQYYAKSYGSDTYYIIYSDNPDCITLCFQYIYNGMCLYSFLVLTSSGQNYLTQFSHYRSVSSSSSVFTGQATITASSFNKNYSLYFDKYSGSTADMANYRELAKLMALSSLDFVDYIYSNYLSSYGNFSVADFGFYSI